MLVTDFRGLWRVLDNKYIGEYGYNGDVNYEDTRNCGRVLNLCKNLL